MSNRAPSVAVVSAPSGAGKSTVLQRVLRELPGLRFSVSHTTRPPRDGEQNDREYHFVSEAVFEEHRAAGGFLEWAEVYGHRYGTSRAELLKAETEGVDLVLDVDVQGAASIKERVPSAMLIFLKTCDTETLRRRLEGRGTERADQIRVRIDHALAELARADEFDYCVINEDGKLDDAVAQVAAIMRAERAQQTSRRHVPELEVALGAAAEDQLAIGREGDGLDEAGVADRRDDGDGCARLRGGKGG